MRPSTLPVQKRGFFSSLIDLKANCTFLNACPLNSPGCSLSPSLIHCSLYRHISSSRLEHCAKRVMIILRSFREKLLNLVFSAKETSPPESETVSLSTSVAVL